MSRVHATESVAWDRTIEARGPALNEERHTRDSRALF